MFTSLKSFFLNNSSKYLFNSIRNLHIVVCQWLLLKFTIGFRTISDCLWPNYAWALVFCCTQTITSKSLQALQLFIVIQSVVTKTNCILACTDWFHILFNRMHSTFFFNIEHVTVNWTCNFVPIQIYMHENCVISNVWSSTFESLCPIGIYFGIF